MENKKRDLNAIEPDVSGQAFQKYTKGSFHDSLGVQVLKCEYGYCLTKTKIRPDFFNHMGGLHGGFLYTIADVTAGLTVFCLEDNSSITTVDGSLQFLRPAINLDAVYGEAETIKDGKRLAFVDVKIMREDGTIIAKGSFTFARIYIADKDSQKTTDLSQ